MKKILIGCLLALLCNCKGRSSDSYADSARYDSAKMDSATDTTSGALQDTAKVAVDSAIKENPIHNTDKQKKRSAILGYSYFKNMRQNETRNINAYVSIINSVSKIVDTLKEINSEIQPERTNDTASIFTQNISLFKYLQISLIDPDSSFIIKPIHNSNRQKIDSLSGNSWIWTVTPRTKKKEARLILKVIAEKSDGSQEAFQARNIPITIHLDTGIFRSIYQWLFDNPEKLLVLILIPLIGFFWKRIAALFGWKEKG